MMSGVKMQLPPSKCKDVRELRGLVGMMNK